jgi:hypothetical protein
MSIPSFLRAGALAAGLAFTADQAGAAIVYSGPMNISIPANFDGVFIDLDGMTSGGSAFAGWDINPFFGGSVIATSIDFHPVAESAFSTATILSLAAGTEVNSSMTFAASPGGSSTHLGPSLTQFAEAVESYIGFRFTTNEAAGPNYGWIRIAVTANNPGGVVKDWAFEDSGAPIAAGVIPEPSALLLAGLGSLLALRRRRC